MAPQANPDTPSSGANLPAVESPSADDLLALIPDMELLETSASDARTAHSEFAAQAGSGRKSGAAPKLIEPLPASAQRTVAPRPVINDDPYAALMPELEAFEDARMATQTIPAPGLRAPAPIAPPAPALQAPLPAPAAIAIPARAPLAAPRPAAPQPGPAAAQPGPAAAPRAPASAKTIKLPDPQTVAVPPVMDRDFIIRNRIVELYVSGSLPVRGATVFERFCSENPQILDEIGLPERVHTGLRLLEASGKPEPWQEKPRPFWERPYVPAALAGLVLVLGIAMLLLSSRLSGQTRKVAALQQLVTDRPLDAATSTTSVDIQPTHIGPDAAIATTIGGAAAQLVNIRIDLTHSDFRAFRITIDRANQGRVAVLNNLIKDSNGELGFALNTSALGAGTYPLTIEGLDWRGDPQPDSWAAIDIRH